MREAPIAIGVISDTHGLLRPEALAALAGSRHVIHAGDIGDPEILTALARIAPVTAVRGNNDRGACYASIPDIAQIVLGGVAITVVHDLGDWSALLGGQVVICGHSHRPRLERVDDVLQLNPGSAGPRRFRLPISIARLVVGRGHVLEAEICRLDDIGAASA